jgi:hypothetical protein
MSLSKQKCWQKKGHNGGPKLKGPGAIFLTSLYGQSAPAAVLEEIIILLDFVLKCVNFFLVKSFQYMTWNLSSGWSTTSLQGRFIMGWLIARLIHRWLIFWNLGLWIFKNSYFSRHNIFITLIFEHKNSSHTDK